MWTYEVHICMIFAWRFIMLSTVASMAETSSLMIMTELDLCTIYSNSMMYSQLLPPEMWTYEVHI